MGPLEITGPARLALGLVRGILFGFILQKAQVTKYQKIVAFFRWSDLTVQKSCSPQYSSAWSGLLFARFRFG